MPLLTINNLSFSYHNKQVLSDVNLSFEKGKITGILGPNGSGKSTLIKNILNYVSPSAGTVYVKLKDIKKYTAKEKATLFGFVPQKSGITSAFTVKEVILMGRVSKLKNSFKGFSQEDHDVVNSVISELKLEELQNDYVTSLSGGEFQRVLLARAICQDPEVLLLDESTANLDLKHSLDITNLISRLVKDKNITCLMVLHDLNLAGMYCDNVVFLKKGKVMHIGATKDLFNMSILQEIYGFSCKVVHSDGCPYVIPKKVI